MSIISGIYWIRNIDNGYVYIGSSANLEKRLRTHKYMLKNNEYGDKKIQKDWNEMGEDFFVFESIKICKRKELKKTEQTFIDRFVPEYNMKKIAVNGSSNIYLDDCERFEQANFVIKQKEKDELERIARVRSVEKDVNMNYLDLLREYIAQILQISGSMVGKGEK